VTPSDVEIVLARAGVEVPRAARSDARGRQRDASIRPIPPASPRSVA
jgi:hypothetical protein